MRMHIHGIFPAFLSPAETNQTVPHKKPAQIPKIKPHQT
jgi:hypothetical protein